MNKYMDRRFFTGFQNSLQQLNCLNPKSADFHNFSTVIENVDTVHTRNYSYIVEENPLSHTMPNPKISLLTEKFEGETYKLIAESVKTNNVRLFRKYMNLNMDLLQVNRKKRNFLHIAAKFGCLEVSQLILGYTSIGVNSRDAEMKSPLHLAAVYGHVTVLQYLHRCGGYLHIKDKLNNTVIDYVIESKNVEVIQFVFEKFPSLCKSFGFDVQELLRQQGISISKTKAIGNDDKSKVKKIEDPVDYVGIEDFHFIQELGKGSFGVVYLVRLIDNQELYAMKIMTKEKIYKERLEVYIQTEKAVMSVLESDFIVKLFFAFQTPQYFCLVMDYCAGGTLAEILNNERILSENKAKKYLSEILLALEVLHSNNILYRDLKPENILIDKDGHIKITDFGLAKQGITDEQSAQSFCGTVSYLAPEVGEKGKYGKSADWYAFGVIMFEMLTGAVPKKSLGKNRRIRVPGYISGDARNLIEGLLCSEYRHRIGYRGTDEVKTHDFFSGVNWELVKLKGLKMDLPKAKEPENESSPPNILPTAPPMKSLDDWSFVRRD